MTPGRPTLETVAQAAGVSAMTVSNAYNRPDQLSEETRARVLAVAKELGYAGPDPAGRSLRTRRAATIGVLLTEQLPYAFADPGLVSFLHGLASGLADAGQALLLVPTEGNAEHAHVRNALVDGFVLTSLVPGHPAVADVLGRRLPVVSWGQPKIPGVPRICVDNARAAAKAARHLLELGHTSFGVVTFGDSAAPLPYADAALTAGDGHPDAPAHVPGVQLGMRARVSGFLRALHAAGIDPASVSVVAAARNSRAAGRDAAARMLADRRPTAVFGVTDVLALGTLDAAASADINVPRQLSVVGFDDVAAAAASVPPLTTVAQSLFDQGRLAANVVLDQVAGRPVRIPPIRTEVVVRGSTAPPILAGSHDLIKGRQP
ncbi:MAG TPA: LacI family DNA-binding transcriptional regulator [Acidothermaceae bacterium]|nr:LacI family DNA-binding transcriptional regulator [Acidothermaceae bacterium]